MTPTEKPEWIEIADKDNSVLPHKISKGLPVMALVVTASILGIGSIFAQSTVEAPANAVEITAPAVQSPESTEPTTATVGIQSDETQNSDKVQNPSIGTLPTNAGDDDEVSGDEFGSADDQDDQDYDGPDDEGADD